MFYLLQILLLLPFVSYLAWHDAKTQRIPLAMNLGTLFIATTIAGYGIQQGIVDFAPLAASALITVSVLWLGVRRRNVGRADVIFGGSLALWVGCYGIFYCLIALFFSAFFSVSLANFTRQKRLAFGPGLATGAAGATLLRLLIPEADLL